MLSSFHASAALYRVVEVTPPSSPTLTYGTDYKSSFGVAIEPTASENSENCFDGTNCNNGSSSYVLSGETRFQKTQDGEPVDGTSFKEEVPFGYINKKEDIYLDAQDDFDDYCTEALGYVDSICSSWSSVYWAERAREIAGVTVTSYAFFQNTLVADDSETEFSSTLSFGLSSSDLYNRVVTGTDGSDSNGFTLSFSNTDRRETITPYPDPSDSNGRERAFKTKTYSGTEYTVGSVSSAYNSDYSYTSKAAIWADSGSGYGSYTELPWKNSSTSSSTYLAQGSIRDFTIVDTDIDGNAVDTIYAVGYNSYLNSNHEYMTATLFTAPVSTYTTATWSQYLVNEAEVTSSDSSYSNTRFTGINNNLVAIGESKLDNSHPANGSYANKLFVVPDVSSIGSSKVTGVTYFSDGGVGIGFDGAGGHANAINNRNEIVGQIDVGTNREVDGKYRRKRGFIYPYSGYNRTTIFNDSAWILDNLTNGGTYSSANNAYRILSANDINDAGVIAATAFKCPGGYSATTIDASCSGTEKTVAVQLIPIEGNTSSDISARGYETTTVERQGASFGLFGLAGLFGLLMYRRKK